MAKSTQAANAAEETTTQAANAAEETVVAKKSVNKKYAEWKVRPVFKQIKDEMDKVIGNKLEGFEKDAQSPVRFTTISPDTAELLNSQAINTNLYLYEV